VIEKESDPRAAFEAFSDAGTTGWMGHSSTNIMLLPDPRRRLFQLKSEMTMMLNRNWRGARKYCAQVLEDLDKRY